VTVIDASAVLALLQDEPGADAVEEAIDRGAVISAVNLAEVLAKMADAGAAPTLAANLVLGLFVEVEPYGLAAALDSAEIRVAAPRAGLSLGDRACLSLARSRDLPVLTADHAWLALAATLGVTTDAVR
jgi:PIN domain nuclease of toxin-antitoxin system